MPLVQRKTLKFIHALLALGLAGGTVQAEENRYDVFAKMLAPFTSVLAKTSRSPNRALQFSGRLERLTGAPPELAGATVEVALQSPDRLRLRGPVLGEAVTLCRDGQQVWGTPGPQLQALLDLATREKKLAAIKKDKPLEPLALPFPEKQLVFLPALFVVKDAGAEAVEGQPCRVLDVTLMPELANQLDEKGWAARLWVRADYRPARIVLRRPGWEVAVKLDRVEFSPRLPEEMWTLPADALRLEARRFRQLVDTLGR